jgi:hypothetical protein
MRREGNKEYLRELKIHSGLAGKAKVLSVVYLHSIPRAPRMFSIYPLIRSDRIAC